MDLAQQDTLMIWTHVATRHGDVEIMETNSLRPVKPLWRVALFCKYFQHKRSREIKRKMTTINLNIARTISLQPSSCSIPKSKTIINKLKQSNNKSKNLQSIRDCRCKPRQKLSTLKLHVQNLQVTKSISLFYA